MTTVEAHVSSLDGTVVLRDAGDNAVADIRLASEAARQGGSQRGGGGQVIGVAGGALMIRCADQYSTPSLLIRVHDAPLAQTGDSGWTWLRQAVIVLESGRLVLDGSCEQPGWPGDVPVGAPGRYAVRVGHRGRAEFQQAASQVRAQTLNASAEDTEAAWESVRGIEAYAMDLWPRTAPDASPGFLGRGSRHPDTAGSVIRALVSQRLGAVAGRRGQLRDHARQGLGGLGLVVRRHPARPGSRDRLRRVRSQAGRGPGAGAFGRKPELAARPRMVTLMAIPEFVVALRTQIGHAPMPLSGVIAVVFDEHRRVLMVRRADTGDWALTTGCLEPGEQPADGAVREVYEETGVTVAVERLLSVEALDLSVAPNGDQVYWLTVGLQCRALHGQARVNDEESVEVGWFDLDTLPALPPHQERCLALAAVKNAAAWIAPATFMAI